MFGQAGWPEYARTLNLGEPWEIRYWSRRFAVPIPELLELAETNHGDIQRICDAVKRIATATQMPAGGCEPHAIVYERRVTS
ncbi:MAG: hypothetical protein QM811_21540 [Pirellulales bacterium]